MFIIVLSEQTSNWTESVKRERRNLVVFKLNTWFKKLFYLKKKIGCTTDSNIIACIDTFTDIESRIEYTGRIFAFSSSVRRKIHKKIPVCHEKPKLKFKFYVV